MFHDTLPLATTRLPSVNEFQRRLRESGSATDTEAGTTRLAGLNPSLLDDLLRFERSHQPGLGLDMMEVLAAALRHGRALLLHLQLEDSVLPLRVLPARREVRSPLASAQLLGLRMPELRVLSVEPAPQDAMGESDAALAEQQPTLMGLLLWELALRGARQELLPEIAGIAAYRVMPGADLSALQLSGTLALAVSRLRRQTTTLREMAHWPGFDTDRATRMLNGLYLQSALMVCRAHPGSISTT